MDKHEELLKYYELIVKCSNKRDDKGLIDALTRVIELNPEDADSYFNLGVAYGHLQDWDNAIKNYTKAIELTPHDSAAYDNRAMVYLDKKDYDNAISDGEKALSLNPNSLAGVNLPSLYQFRGNRNLEAGKYDEAVADYSTIIERFTKYAYADVYAGRAEAYRNMKNYTDMENDLNKAKMLSKCTKSGKRSEAKG